jgi:uncharacterized protein (DUF983 family)
MVERFTISMDDEVAKKIEIIMNAQDKNNRSEFIGELMREGLRTLCYKCGNKLFAANPLKKGICNRCAADEEIKNESI